MRDLSQEALLAHLKRRQSWCAELLENHRQTARNSSPDSEAHRHARTASFWVEGMNQAFAEIEEHIRLESMDLHELLQYLEKKEAQAQGRDNPSVS